MNLEEEMARLTRQNRRLKRALISMVAIFLVGVAMGIAQLVIGYARAAQAREAALRAHARAEQALAAAKARFEEPTPQNPEAK
jgi:hypothetical protein